MKIFSINKWEWGLSKIHEVFVLLLALLFIWFTAPYWVYNLDKHIALADPGIWSLVLIALIAFILIIWFSWFLLNTCWEALALPSFSLMVIHFKNLELWQQFVFYWASFALFLLGAVITLAAIC
jgi:TRAP-type C4-dicarboxylate transport system permease small subunit